MIHAYLIMHSTHVRIATILTYNAQNAVLYANSLYSKQHMYAHLLFELSYHRLLGILKPICHPVVSTNGYFTGIVIAEPNKINRTPHGVIKD